MSAGPAEVLPHSPAAATIHPFRYPARGSSGSQQYNPAIACTQIRTACKIRIMDLPADPQSGQSPDRTPMSTLRMLPHCAGRTWWPQAEHGWSKDQVVIPHLIGHDRINRFFSRVLNAKKCYGVTQAAQHKEKPPCPRSIAYILFYQRNILPRGIIPKILSPRMTGTVLAYILG